MQVTKLSTQNSFFIHRALADDIVRQNDGLGFNFGLHAIHPLQDALIRKNIRIKIVLILTRTPAGPNLLTHKGRSSDLFPLSRLPNGSAVSGKECDRTYPRFCLSSTARAAYREWNLQQQVLFRIHTEFPFHPLRRGSLGEPFALQR